jgi:hypothetical protein
VQNNFVYATAAVVVVVVVAVVVAVAVVFPGEMNLSAIEILSVFTAPRDDVEIIKKFPKQNFLHKKEKLQIMFF